MSPGATVDEGDSPQRRALTPSAAVTVGCLHVTTWPCSSGAPAKFLRDAINNVIDVDAFNADVTREKQDAGSLETVRKQALAVLGRLGTAD